jgi:UPF0755 protein
MSRDGYEQWGEGPEASDEAAYDPREGRRARRAGRGDEQWPPDAQAPDRSARHASHRRSSQYPDGTDSGYPDSGYTDPGHTEPGAGYGNPGYTEPGYSGGGYGGPGYDEPGYGGGQYGDERYPGSGQPDRGRADSYRQPDDYGTGGGYASGRHSGPGYYESGEYGTAGQRSADGVNGHRDGGYPADGYPDAGYGQAGRSRPAAQDRFASQAPFPGQDDRYGAPDPYGPPDPHLRDSGAHTDPRGSSGPRSRNNYGGQDPYAGRAGYDTGDPYAGPDSRAQRGDSQAGYDSQARYEEPAAPQYSGGYDQHDTGGAAGADPREWYRDQQPDRGRSGDRDQAHWQDPVDETGVRRRRGRDAEDELDPDSARHNGFFRGFGAAEDEFGHRPPRRRRSKAGFVALVVLVLFLGGIVGGGAYAYHWYSARHADWTGSKGYGTVLVQVPTGAVACGALENTLLRDGVIASASAFCTAAKSSGQSNLLQPGTFRLHKHMGAALAWALIISPKARVQSTVTVPDGMRTSKVIAVLAAKTGIPLSQFVSALNDTAALGLPSWANGNPEGFLWPATYNFPPGTSALTMLQTMVKQFNTEIASIGLPAKAHAAQFTEYQVIIQASLLEGEVPPQYYTKVARVIDNRLNQNPPWDLGLDSTVAYAVNKYIYDLSQSDLNVNSPYNTTKHPGLPPGPIDSPDLAAIQAVLQPAQGSWLYFVTVNKQGLTLFTSSSSQFNIWAQEATKNGV